VDLLRTLVDERLDEGADRVRRYLVGREFVDAAPGG